MKSKKIISAITSTLLAVALFVVSIVPASAADGNTITIHPGATTASGHAERFTAYQIFKGTVPTGSYENGNTPLSNIEWGTNIDGDTIVNAMKNDTSKFPGFKDYIEAIKPAEMGTALATARWLADDGKECVKAFAKLCASNVKDDGTQSTRASDTGDFTIDVPSDGYYVVKDTVTSGDHMSGSSYIAYVSGNAEVNIKSSVPAVTKKVNDADATIVEIGKNITFTLTGTVADNIEDYETYAYKFIDTLPEGLDYNNDAKVTIGGTQITPNDNLTINYEPSSRALTVNFTNLKTISEVSVDKDSKIVVTYTGKLNANASVGNTPNSNSVKVTYSSDPYSTTTGTTTADKVDIYTLGIDITKQNGTDGGTLQGVDFVLKKGDQFAEFTNDGSTYTFKDWTSSEGTTLTTGEDGVLTLKGLETGSYVLSETKPLNGFDTMADIEFTIEATATEGNLTVTNPTIDRNDVSTSVDENKDINFRLINYKSPVLPHTGGVGRTMFYIASVIAGLLAITVIAVLLRKKKTNNE